MYQVIIKEISTGKTVLDEKTDSIIGAIHKTGNAYTSFTYIACDTLTSGNTAASVISEIDRLMASDQSVAAVIGASRSLYLKKILEASQRNNN